MGDIYEDADPRIVQLEKMRAHLLRVVRGWRPEHFTSPELYRERVAFAERCVGNLERAIEREKHGAADSGAQAPS